MAGRPAPQNGPKLPYSLSSAGIIDDLTAERPQWVLSSYGPGIKAPEQLFGGPEREQSFEEMRLLHYMGLATGNGAQAVGARITTIILQRLTFEKAQHASTLEQNAELQNRNVLNDVDGAIKYILAAENQHPNRIDLTYNPGTASNPTASFSAQPRGTTGSGNPFSSNNGPSQSAPGFGQPSSLGQSSNPFGAPRQQVQSSLAGPFGQPSALGRNVNPFGAPSQPATSTTFGVTPPAAALNPFSSTPAPTSSNPFGATQQTAAVNPFGAPQAAAVNPFGAPAQSIPANPFGAPTQSVSANPFGASVTLTQSNPFGAPAQPQQMNQLGQPPASNPFGNPPSSQPQLTPFGAPQPAQQNPFGAPPPLASSFGLPQSNASNNSNPFGQPSVRPQENPFGQPASQLSGVITSPSADSAQQELVTNGISSHRLSNSDFEHPPIHTYSSHDGNGRLTMFKGKQVMYKGAEAGVRNRDGTWEKIWFPNGPPPFDRNTEFEDSSYDDSVKSAYLHVRETGMFAGGVMPLVPPKREWCLWDF